MDTLDIKILKELVKNNVMPFPSPALRKSFRNIGKDLQVDQGTIRNRIRKFEQGGLINGFYLGVNPSLFELRIGALFFDVRPQSEKENLKRKISAMDKALLICDYLGPKLSVVFCYANDEDLKRITRQITRMANSEEVICQDKPFLACNELTLTSSDWKIINALQKENPWKKSFSSVAREAELSTKTVKNRIQRLVEEGAIYLLASVNLESFEGFIPADLNIVYESPESRDRVIDLVREYLGDMLVFADLQDQQYGYFALAVPNISKIRAIENQIRISKGIRSARVEVIHDILSIRRFYGGQVKKGMELPRVSAPLKVS